MWQLKFVKIEIFELAVLEKIQFLCFTKEGTRKTLSDRNGTPTFYTFTIGFE